MIIGRWRYTCLVTGRTHDNDGWFRDAAHFVNVLAQWNTADQSHWPRRYEALPADSTEGSR